MGRKGQRSSLGKDGEGKRLPRYKVHPNRTGEDKGINQEGERFERLTSHGESGGGGTGHYPSEGYLVPLALRNLKKKGGGKGRRESEILNKEGGGRT